MSILRNSGDCVDRLARLLGVSGRRGGSFDWSAVEASVGLRLPADYKNLVETFPDGRFQGLVRLNRPGDDEYPPDEFLGFYAYQLGDMRSWRETGHGTFPYPIFPEPGGLLPWASGPRMEPFFWLTEDENPDHWPTVTADYGFTEWRHFPGTACEFLFEVVRGRFDGSIFGRDLGARSPSFEPIVEQPEPAPGKPGPFFWEMLRMKPGQPNDEMAKLAETLGPPPAGTRRTDWARVEQRLGFPLPSDYKAFVDAYGAGTFCDIAIAAPGGPGDADLFSFLDRTYARVADLDRDQFCPPVYPEPAGMIAWGESADGYTFCWPPVGTDPDRWGVLVARPGDPPLTGVARVPDQSFSSVLSTYAAGGQLDLLAGRKPWAGDPAFVPVGR